MGQILLADNIPNAVRGSTTTITLAASNNGQPTRITLGGQQYALSAGLSLSTGSVGANGLDAGSLAAIQLWYVYAIVNTSSFAPALVASLTAPSAGPTMPSGYGTNYKLVGAFYTDGSSTVGSMVQISGTIQTEWMSYVPVLVNLGSGGITAGSLAKFRRVGDSVHVNFQWFKDGTAGTGAGFVTTGIPAGLNWDTNKVASTSAGIGRWGSATQLTGGAFGTKYMIALRSAVNTTGVLFTNDAGSDNLTGNAIAANSGWYGEFILPVSGWTSTLL